MNIWDGKPAYPKFANRYLQAEKSQRTVKYIWFLPTQKPTLKSQKSLPFLSPPKLNDNFYTHLMSIPEIFPTLVDWIKRFKMNRIKAVLEQKGIKQIWLAEQLEKSYNMVHSYVQNKRQPSIDDLYKIAEILNVDIKELLVSNKPEQDNRWNQLKYSIMYKPS